MTGYMTQLRGCLLFFLSIIYIIHVFTGWPGEGLIIATAMVAFLVSLPYMGRFPGAMTIVMFGLGQSVFMLYHGGWDYWVDALMQNLPMVALFVTVPLLSIPLRAGGYVAYMASLTGQLFTRPVLTHAAVAGSSLLLTSFMNIGSIRVMDELFGRGLLQKKKLFATAIMQGFSLAAILSPYIAGVAIILYMLHVTLIPFLFYGCLMVLIGMLVTVGVTFLDSKQKTRLEAAVSADQPGGAPEHLEAKKGLQLLLALAGLFVAIIWLEAALKINLIVIISLIALIYPLLWLALLRRPRGLSREFKRYWQEVLPNVHNESVMIVGAGFFSLMLQLSPVPRLLSAGFGLLRPYPLFITVLAILMVVVLLSLIGVHQILPTTVLAASISPESIGLHPILFALTLTVGWAMVTQVSPVAALNIVASHLFHVKGWQLTLWNWKFVLSMVILTTLIVNLLNPLLMR